MDNKRYLRAVGIFIIYCLLIMELPYKEKSILTYIAPPIHFGDGTLHLTGIIGLIVLIWIYKEIVASKQFETENVIIFIIFFFMVVPFSTQTINAVKNPFYYLHNDVGSIEIEESNISISKVDDIDYINVELEIKGHRTLDEDFKIIVKLDEELMDSIEKIENNDENIYHIGGRETVNYEISLPVTFKEGNGYIDDSYIINRSDYFITFESVNSKREHLRNDRY